MPYDTPPDKIKGMPIAAQHIWMAAFNNAWKEYNGDEGKCAATAYSAVEKAGYKQDKDGKWLKEELQEELNRGTERLRNSEFREDAPFAQAVELEPHTFRVQLMNLEEPAVKKRGWTGNSKYYSDKALESMARLSNNKKSMASGHHDDARLRETAGLVKNVAKVPGKKVIEGDYEVLGEAQGWLEPLIRKQVETPDANLLSLSINAGGSYFWGEQDGKRGKIVEDVNYFESADVVFNPAAGGNFKKILEEYRRRKTMDITLKELKEENADLVKQIKEEALAEIQKTLKEEREAKEKAERELTALKEEKIQAESKTSAEKLLKESKLNEAQAKGLMEAMTGKKEDEQKRLVEERKEYLRSLAKDLKVDNLGFDSKEQPGETKITEEQRRIWTQMNFTEEQMQRIVKGQALQEAKK
jgi:cation transport regulator ChaB